VSEGPGRAFRRAFARDEVKSLAGRRSFERGVLYAANGRVGTLAVTAASVKAKVRGSSSHQVRLWLGDDDEAAYRCSCPAGQDDRFCKHAVAVALVVTETDAGAGEQDGAVIDLAGYLAGLDHQALVDLLLERAAEDDLFDARLRMAAARAVTGAPSLGVFRHALDEAFIVNGYVGYREMYDYASNIGSVLDSLQDLLDDGHAEQVITLAEHAIDRAEDAVGYVDDSDGWMSGIAERLGELHLAACEAARPNPVTLARTLFEHERHDGDLEVFHGAARAYADVLGERGLAEYRRLAQQEWDALPALGPDDEREAWSSGRFRITQIMHTLAEVTGDVDAVVEVLVRDQSSAYQFVRIAEVLHEAGRYDDAMEWALKGLGAHGYADSRLVEVAAAEHHRAGRGDQAVQVVWTAYDAAPSLRTYRHLAEHAQRAGVWSDWHDRALELLRSRITKQPSGPQTRGRTKVWPAPSPDTSTLVEVLLFDRDVEQAWAEAKVGGCRREQWTELARLREDEHPADAIPIWQTEVDRQISAKNNQSYAEAVTLIERVERLMKAADRESEFTPYVEGLRVTHKPKRNLMKLFAERGW
jgi:uncharacterized Zn finger protein